MEGWHVYRILDEEKYAGTQVYNRHSGKLGTKTRTNPPSLWIRKPNAFPAIIDPEVFRKVQMRRSAARRRLSDEEVLDMLRRLLARRGYLSQRMIVPIRACLVCKPTRIASARCTTRFG